jgi:hypothetical protein
MIKISALYIKEKYEKYISSVIMGCPLGMWSVPKK